MLEATRAQLKNIPNTSTTFMTHESIGMAGEAVSGKMFQHYGFTSVPPEDGKTTLITIQDGNNNYSIAEKYPFSVATQSKNKNFKEGDTYLYSTPGGSGTTDQTCSVYLSNENKSAQIDTPNTQIILAENAPGNPNQPNIGLLVDNGTVKSNINMNGDGAGTVYININNLQVASSGNNTPLFLANQNLVQALGIFMTTISSATTAAQIAAAATTFLGTPAIEFITQSVKGA